MFDTTAKMADRARILKIAVTAAPKLKFENENDVEYVFQPYEHAGPLSLLGAVSLPKLLLSYPLISIFDNSRNIVEK